MEINQKAPVKYQASITIDAPVETVWHLMTDIKNWPQWNPEITDVTIEGDLAAGTVFSWKGKGSSLTSELQVVEPLQIIGWTGKTMGIRAVHVYRFARNGTGTTVTSEESWEGLLVTLTRGYMQKLMAKSLDGGLACLKAAAEKK